MLIININVYTSMMKKSTILFYMIFSFHSGVLRAHIKRQLYFLTSLCSALFSLLQTHQKQPKILKKCRIFTILFLYDFLISLRQKLIFKKQLGVLWARLKRQLYFVLGKNMPLLFYKFFPLIFLVLCCKKVKLDVIKYFFIRSKVTLRSRRS